MNMATYSWLLTAPLVLSCLGCIGGTVGVQKVRAAPPRADDCRLDVFVAGETLSRPYETVCMIDSFVRTNREDLTVNSAATIQARKAACRCGADALLVEEPIPSGATGLGSDAVVSEGFRWLAGIGKGSLIMKAVRYTNPPKPE